MADDRGRVGNSGSDNSGSESSHAETGGAEQTGTVLTLSWKTRLAEVDRAAWNALAEPLTTPILEWEWLNRMEVSGSVAPETGWQPCHLTVWVSERSGPDAGGNGERLIAAAPLYIKSHSAGEFVYDYMWADAANQLGVEYYPKMVGVSPATPAVGYRFLVAPDVDEDRITTIMLEEIDRFCRQHRIHGCSFLFVDPEWRVRVERFGYHSWLHQSYAWRNKGYDSFADYLAMFKKNQRRNIRRERMAMEDQEIAIEPVTGDDIPQRFFPLMYHYYERTNAQFGPWAAKYLTREFFEGLEEDYRHRILFMAAYQRGGLRGPSLGAETPVGMSFLLTKKDVLIGRYWGAERKLDALHFNACYYSPIEWAIDHGVRIFDPGAGSPHKLRRGFEAVPNHSLHRFYDEKLKIVMEAYIARINSMEQEQIEAMNEAIPFSSDTGSERLDRG